MCPIVSYLINQHNLDSSLNKHAFDTLIKMRILKDDTLYKTLVQGLVQQQINLIQLLQYKTIDTKQLYTAIAKHLNMRYIDTPTAFENSDFNAAPLFLDTLSMPIAHNQNSLCIALKDPFCLKHKQRLLQAFNKYTVEFVVVHALFIDTFLHKLQTTQEVNDFSKKISTQLLQVNSEDTSLVMEFITYIVRYALKQRASDIHIEARKHSAYVRARIDGKLHTLFEIDLSVYHATVSRIKLLGHADIAVKRLPQDGRFSMNIDNQSYDFRLSTLPSLHGESLVLRILHTQDVTLSLDTLGMSHTNLLALKKALSAPYGLVLITGPTGAGKTTTLYGALNALDHHHDKIITVEDPIEYHLEGITQVGIHSGIAFDFATALRAILRQDPDTIMVGEIRDTQTLNISVQAALTGHKVLSTLHTNDAISAIWRMIDMGSASYLLSSALLAVGAQRLVRTICKECKTSYTPKSELLNYFGSHIEHISEFYHGVGCKKCGFTGYFGRQMVSEFLIIDTTLSSMIARNTPYDALMAYAKEQGFVCLKEDAIQKVAQGVTTLDEVLNTVML